MIMKILSFLFLSLLLNSTAHAESCIELKGVVLKIDIISENIAHADSSTDIAAELKSMIDLQESYERLRATLSTPFDCFSRS